MFNLVVGLGVQGKKRVKFLKGKYITLDAIKKMQIIINFQMFLLKILHMLMSVLQKKKNLI